MRVLQGLLAVAGAIALAILWLARSGHELRNLPLHQAASSLHHGLAVSSSSPEPPAHAARVASAGHDAQRGMAVQLASHAPMTSAEHSSAPKGFVDGVEAAKSIDWDSVERMSPIPRLMPTRPAADAVDAGFAPEWFEHSIGRWMADSINYHGKSESIWIQSLASQIMSESKSADDNWATGMEAQLRSMIAGDTSADLISRVFCNGQGCLCYIEDEDPSVHEGVREQMRILKSLRDDAWAQGYGITYPGAYATGTHDWSLILIPRPR